MALADLKETIINNSKKVEICDKLHDAQIAGTEEDLIIAGLTLVVWLYQSGVIDDALLADFDETKLNAAGIYTKGTFSLSNPSTDIYILKSANVTFTIDGNNKASVYILGNATVSITANDSSYVTVKSYGSSVIDLAMNNNTMGVLETRDTNQVTTVQNDDSILHIFGSDISTIILSAHDQSYTLARMYNNASIAYELFDTAVIDVLKYQNAFIINSES